MKVNILYVLVGAVAVIFELFLLFIAVCAGWALHKRSIEEGNSK